MLVNDYLALKTCEGLAEKINVDKQHVLEVGAADCELSALLSIRGAKVWAVDSLKPTKIPSGVTFLQGFWPDEIENRIHHLNLKFDVIIFSRSLQLMAELAPAIVAAQRLLAPGGAIYIEGFAFSDSQSATITWVHQMIDWLHAKQLGDQTRHGFYKILASLTASPDRALWMENDTCFSHSVAAVNLTLAQYAENNGVFVEEDSMPFFFRHFAVMLDDQSQHQVIQNCFELEVAAIERQDIQAIGRRWWISQKPPLPLI